MSTENPGRWSATRAMPLLLSLVIAAAPAWSQETETPEQPTSRPSVETESNDSLDLSGYVSLSYRGRKRGSSNDEDLYGLLSFDAGKADRDDVTFHFFGRGTLDLDGDPDRSASPFFSLNDVGGDRFDFHVYDAWVDLRRSLAPTALGVKRVRLGRQTIFAGYTYLLDGVRFDFERLKKLANLEISVYGGIPQFLYESSSSGDWLAGADATLWPARGTRVDLRYAHVADENHAAGIDEADDYASIVVRQKLTDDVFLTAEWNTLDAETRDVRATLDWEFPKHDLALTATYRYQDTITREFSTEFDPYLAILGPSFAWHQFDVQASKMIGSDWSVDAGFTSRQLDDEADEGAFNREFVRAWLTLASEGWPTPDLDVALTGEIWDGDADSSATAGFEITWRPIEELRVRAGTYYSLYKYDLFVVDEREDATTLYLKARWRFREDFRLDSRYEFETGDDGSFHTLWIGLTWTF